MEQRLLIIDDDRRLAKMVAVYLRQNGFEVDHAETATSGLLMLQSAGVARPYCIVILDVMLPDGSGLDTCKLIRTHLPPIGSVGILMLTAKGDTVDKIVGLEVGADDYLAKPFDPRELLARLRSILRRNQPATQDQGHLLCFGHLNIDKNTRSVQVRKRDVLITSHQFDLLVAMAEKPGRVLSRESLLDAVGSERRDQFDRSIDIHIGRLRAAIEDDPKKPRRILTVRGAGYVFARIQDGLA
jgi:DNA-binding response OmpR family regulator